MRKLDPLRGATHINHNPITGLQNGQITFTRLDAETISVSIETDDGFEPSDIVVTKDGALMFRDWLNGFLGDE